jgi:hypothetical protein
MAPQANLSVVCKPFINLKMLGGTRWITIYQLLRNSDHLDSYPIMSYVICHIYIDPLLSIDIPLYHKNLHWSPIFVTSDVMARSAPPGIAPGWATRSCRRWRWRDDLSSAGHRVFTSAAVTVTPVM